MRVWYPDAGASKTTAFADDYAHLLNFYCALCQAGSLQFLEIAEELAEIFLARFLDSDGWFQTSAKDAERLVAVKLDVEDNAVPSAGSVAADALFQLSALTGNQRWAHVAESQVVKLSALASEHPLAFANWFRAIERQVLPPTEVLIGGNSTELRNTANQYLLPASVQISTGSSTPDLPITEGKDLSEPAGFVCSNYTCNEPAQSTAKLRAQLEGLFPVEN